MEPQDYIQLHKEEIDGRINRVVYAQVAEYNTLRQESLQGIDNRIKVITFGFGAVSLMISGGITATGIDLFIKFLLLGIIVPIVSTATIFMWLGEYQRSMRAGHHIRQVERYLNFLVGGTPLRWESGLTARRLHMSYPYLAPLSLMMMTSMAGVMFGSYFIFECAKDVAQHLPWYMKVVPVKIAITLSLDGPTTAMLIYLTAAILSQSWFTWRQWRVWKSIRTQAGG